MNGMARKEDIAMDRNEKLIRDYLADRQKPYLRNSKGEFHFQLTPGMRFCSLHGALIPLENGIEMRTSFPVMLLESEWERMRWIITSLNEQLPFGHFEICEPMEELMLRAAIETGENLPGVRYALRVLVLYAARVFGICGDLILRGLYGAETNSAAAFDDALIEFWVPGMKELKLERLTYPQDDYLSDWEESEVVPFENDDSDEEK